jgi:hypothetical protein
MKIFIILRIIDFLTTFVLIERFGAVEANPLMKTVISFGWEYYIIFQLFSTYVILLLTKKYKHKWIDIALVVINILSGIVILGNIWSLLILA